MRDSINGNALRIDCHQRQHRTTLTIVNLLQLILAVQHILRTLELTRPKLLATKQPTYDFAANNAHSRANDGSRPCTQKGVREQTCDCRTSIGCPISDPHICTKQQPITSIKVTAIK